MTEPIEVVMHHLKQLPLQVFILLEIRVGLKQRLRSRYPAPLTFLCLEEENGVEVQLGIKALKDAVHLVSVDLGRAGLALG